MRCSARPSKAFRSVCCTTGWAGSGRRRRDSGIACAPAGSMSAATTRHGSTIHLPGSAANRKTITVDSTIAFVTGLCVGRMWAGDLARHIDPWRDTGVELRGPAVADVEAAFAEAWAAAGDAPSDTLTRAAPSPAGDVPLRVVATVPNTAGLFRVDQLVAAMARQTLWLTDAYYGGTRDTWRPCARLRGMVSTFVCSCQALLTSR